MSCVCLDLSSPWSRLICRVTRLRCQIMAEGFNDSAAKLAAQTGVKLLLSRGPAETAGLLARLCWCVPGAARRLWSLWILLATDASVSAAVPAMPVAYGAG